jgi:hypothetical protein
VLAAVSATNVNTLDYASTIRSRNMTTAESTDVKSGVQSDDATVDATRIDSVLRHVRKELDSAALAKAVADHITALANKHNVGSYKILMLFDDRDEISEWHANRLYSAASSGETKNILLLIHSSGGSIEPAYLISKTCMKHSAAKFVVAVPRKAKSAATLIALGAHEIHMGLMSELGPIDPQIGGFPALGMQNALSLLADLSCKFPGSSEMLGRYLSEKLDLRILGYFERISESAVQYAERLLDGKSPPPGATAKSLANHFVNHYKDHGFVIDVDEAQKLLGESIVKQQSPEYRFANEVHESLDFLGFVLEKRTKNRFDYVGGVDGFLVRASAAKD